jgi:hypothetical protein
VAQASQAAEKVRVERILVAQALLPMRVFAARTFGTQLRVAVLLDFFRSHFSL